MSVSNKSSKNSKTKLEISPNTIVKAGESQLKGFIDFIRTQGVIGLAVGSTWWC